MSTVKLDKINFLSNGSVNIEGTNTSTIAITTNNVVVANRFQTTNTGSMASASGFVDSANASFWFDPAGTSVLNYPKVNSLGMSLTRMASESGLGSVAIWSGSRPFIASSTGGGWSVYTGRGASGTSSIESADRFTHFNNPAETTEPIDYGMYAQFCFALYANGNLYTWGNNAHGQCGLGNTTATSIPTLAATNVVAVYHHPTLNGFDASSKMVIKKRDGYLYAAGYNGSGQLGVGDTTNRSSFTVIPFSFGAISVWNIGGSTGGIVIQTAEYKIWACGYNGHGQLGTGDTTNRPVLTDVTTNWGGVVNSGRRLVKLICGLGFADTAYNTRSWIGMLLDDGTTTYFRIAGNNGYGSLGLGTVTDTNYSTPQTPVLPAARISDVSGYGGGPGTIMVLFADGNLYIWGHNGNGQVGNGTTTNNGTPTLVTTGVEKIFCDGHDSASYGYRRTSFYRKGGILYSVGYNEHGQCGLGNTTNPITSWTSVKLPADFVCNSIGTYSTTSAGFGYIFFGTDGRMFMTGYNAHNMVTWESTTNVLSPIEIRPAFGG
jgi:alpha-tubulin suppressor-like RCC1 family protein